GLEEARGVGVEERRHADADQMTDLDDLGLRLSWRQAGKPHSGQRGAGFQELPAFHGTSPCVMAARVSQHPCHAEATADGACAMLLRTNPVRGERILPRFSS